MKANCWRCGQSFDHRWLRSIFRLAPGMLCDDCRASFDEWWANRKRDSR